jgi:hypothetical protein
VPGSALMFSEVRLGGPQVASWEIANEGHFVGGSARAAQPDSEVAHTIVAFRFELTVCDADTAGPGRRV